MESLLLVALIILLATRGFRATFSHDGQESDPSLCEHYFGVLDNAPVPLGYNVCELRAFGQKVRVAFKGSTDLMKGEGKLVFDVPNETRLPFPPGRLVVWRQEGLWVFRPF
ncbi:MAG: hypothetical protein WC045_00135 [Patescibacteria group bacterium]